jgi:hypothetical protein
MRSTPTPIQQLRTAVYCLPEHTRRAMLEGMARNDIIVGAYASRDGGICPMLAAHRCGGRTDFLSFARAWDRFSGAKRQRKATRRELRVLTAHLRASLAEAPDADLAAAIAAHRELVRRRVERQPADWSTGQPPDSSTALTSRDPHWGQGTDTDRAPERRHRPGWAWLRPFRRLDDYERALEELESQSTASTSTGADSPRSVTVLGA